MFNLQTCPIIARQLLIMVGLYWFCLDKFLFSKDVLTIDFIDLKLFFSILTGLFGFA